MSDPIEQDIARVVRATVGSEGGKPWCKKYLDEDKGVIKTTCHDGSTCSISFLKAILHNLRFVLYLGFYRFVKKAGKFKARRTKTRVRMASATRNRDVQIGAKNVVACLAATLLELKRLQEHPELYPSKTIKREFLRSVHMACDLMLKKLFSSDKALVHGWDAFRKAVDDNNKKTVLPTYDEQRTSWQQFLHKMAPGSGVRLPPVTGEETYQLVPQAGLRLILDALERSRGFKRALQALRGDSTALVTEIPPFSLSDPKLTLEKTLRSCRQVMMALGPVRAGSAAILRGGGTTTLETLNADFAALDGRPKAQSWNGLGLSVREFTLPAWFWESFAAKASELRARESQLQSA